MADHPVRTCLGCGQSDDHPRHQVVLGDGSSAYWHNDCHKIVTGCPECTAVVASAGELKGDELRDHIVANDPAGQTAPTSAPSEPATVTTAQEG